MILGRLTERAAIEEMLRQASRARGGGVLLHGEPGIGKTALLEYAVEQASGMRVLSSAGVEPESVLGYATLHRLLMPVLGRIERLPDPQARALGVVFGLREGATPDRFLVSLATLSLLSQVAEEQPLLCVVDDVHWADQLSLDTLAFVARRLDAEPIALALATRPAEKRTPMPGLIDLPLAGLDTESAQVLLTDCAGTRFTRAERAALLRATGSNPLAIRQLLTESSRASLQTVLSGAPLPLTDELRKVFHERIQQRDPTVRRLLLLIACDSSGRMDVLRRAADDFGANVDALLSGELDELVSTDVPATTFRHPLIRSAVYYGAPIGQRRAAHRAWAAALDGDAALDGNAEGLERRSWHLGQAAVEPDESVAAELERSAHRLSRRAGPANAAAALTRAAELTVSDQRRAPRLVAAATAWWDSGAPSRSTVLLDEAERLACGTPAVRRDIAGLRAMIEVRTGSPSAAVDLLLPILPDALHADLASANRLLMLFAKASLDGNTSHAQARVHAALEELPLHGIRTAEVVARVYRAAFRVRVGADPGLLPGDLDALEQLDHPVLLGTAGGLLRALGQFDRALRLRHKAVNLARTTGAAGALAGALDAVVCEELDRGRLSVAEAYAEEGYQLALEARQPNTACCHQSWLTLLAALRGGSVDVEQLAESVIAEASERQLRRPEVTARWALGLYHLAAGDPGKAMDQLSMMHRGGADRGLMFFTAPDLIEAAVRADEPDRAADALRLFTAWAESTNAPQPLAIAARCRALLASGDTVEPEFEQALQLHARTDAPLAQARTQLLFGQYLRRKRRRSDARDHLRAALDTFHHLGVAPWAQIARDELRATGLRGQRPATNVLATLSPQETRIALAVSSGITNREIAAQLFLSPRTIDYHLRKIFQKVGIRSRAELIHLVLAEYRDIEAESNRN